jgi:endonuclease/exonuclease/phosphatase (EEP) superfamily protein YafD
VTVLLDLDAPHLVIGLLAAAASMSPLATAGAVLVTTLALRGRRWITGGLAIAAGLLPWIFVLPYAVPAPTTHHPVTVVRVLVVNAQTGHAEPKDISALVRDQSVDLLVVTELTSRMAHDLTVEGLDGRLIARWVSVPPLTAAGAAEQSGLGLWSRLPMSGFTKVPGTHWPAVRAALETGHGRLTVVAGHAVPPTVASGGIWTADLAALHEAARGLGPVTVVGGLNGTPWNAQFRTAAGNGLHDAGDVLGRGIRPTWPSWLGIPLLPLDHSLVGGGVGVQSLTGAKIDGTDHRALMVTLLVPGKSS